MDTAPSAASPTTTRPACSTGETPGATINTSCPTAEAGSSGSALKTFAQFKTRRSRNRLDLAVLSRHEQLAGRFAGARHRRAPGQRYRIIVDRQAHVGPHPDRHRRRQRRRSLHGRRQRHRRDCRRRRVRRLELHTDRPRRRVACRRRQRDRRRRRYRQRVAHLQPRHDGARHRRAPGQRYRIVVYRRDHVRPNPDRRR